MARKKPARPVRKAAKKPTKKAAPKAAARKVVKKTAKKAAKKPAKPAKSKKTAAKKVVKKAAPIKKSTRQAAGIKAAATKKATVIVKKAKQSAAGVKAAATKAKAKANAAVAPDRKANLDRPRKTVADIHGIPSSLGMGAIASAAHSGFEELKDTLKKNTSASPRLTAGDVDANWQAAESQGDESPGGDNPTPDQDVVDEIGRALGVEYADDEELQGGAEIAERDAHRWELDPASKEDFEDEE
jgi:hypothetical protein